jgi:hypothetical protein
MGSKTPVSILQEMCALKCNPPQYELIHHGGGTHEALFKYRVSVGQITGTQNIAFNLSKPKVVLIMHATSTSRET